MESGWLTAQMLFETMSCPDIMAQKGKAKNAMPGTTTTKSKEPYGSV